eukprot:gene8337-biopygen13470
MQRQKRALLVSPSYATPGLDIRTRYVMEKTGVLPSDLGKYSTEGFARDAALLRRQLGPGFSFETLEGEVLSSAVLDHLKWLLSHETEVAVLLFCGHGMWQGSPQHGSLVCSFKQLVTVEAIECVAEKFKGTFVRLLNMCDAEGESMLKDGQGTRDAVRLRGAQMQGGAGAPSTYYGMTVAATQQFGKTAGNSRGSKFGVALGRMFDQEVVVTYDGFETALEKMTAKGCFSYKNATVNGFNITNQLQVRVEAIDNNVSKIYTTDENGNPLPMPVNVSLRTGEDVNVPVYNNEFLIVWIESYVLAVGGVDIMWLHNQKKQAFSASNGITAFSLSAAVKSACDSAVSASNQTYGIGALDSNGDILLRGNLRISETANIYKGTEVFSSGGVGGVGGIITSDSNIVSSVNGTQDLGAPDKRWRNLYLSGNLISFGNGMNIDGYSWNYLANYVVPQRVLENTVSTYLFTGAAQDHSAYVRNGELYMYGRNDYGQLGLGHTSNIAVPTKVPGITNAALVACGERFTLCVRIDGTAISTGQNNNGQLGIGSTVTTSNFSIVAGVSNAIAVAAGYTHAMYMTSNGIVVSAGSDANGQLGRGASSANVVINANIVPMLMPDGSNVYARAISAGGYHSAVLLNNGSAYLCGKNDQGQCGASPTLVPQANSLGIISTLSNVVDVACGHEHTLFTRYDGQVLGFGRNDRGQLGQGNKTSPVTSVVQVLAGGGAGSSNGLSVEIAAGFNHSAYVKNDITIFVFGANDKGQLGLGQTTTEALTPTQLVGYAGYDIACGRNHTVISTTPDPLTFNYTGNKALIAFGDNAYGQVGDNNPNVTTRWFPNRIHDGTFKKKLHVGSSADISAYVDTDGVLFITGSKQIAAGTSHAASIDGSETVSNLLVNFTGQHRCFVDALAPARLRDHEGLVVVTNKNAYPSGLLRGRQHAMTINQALPLVSLSKVPKDPRAFGVISLTQDHPAGPSAAISGTELLKITEQGDVRVQINSIGEGCIWVCDETGSTIHAGDYVTTSSLSGYASLQVLDDGDVPDGFLRNYTVAKLTMDCDFSQPLVDVEEVQKDEYGNVVFDADGSLVYTIVTTTQGPSVVDPVTRETRTGEPLETPIPVTEPAYEMRWMTTEIDASDSGVSITTLISEEDYEKPVHLQKELKFHGNATFDTHVSVNGTLYANNLQSSFNTFQASNIFILPGGMIQFGEGGSSTISFSNAPDTGLFNPVARTLGVVAGGTEMVRVSDTTVSLLGDLVVSSNIVPMTNATQYLGASTMHFKEAWIDELHISSNTLYIGDTPVLCADNDAVSIRADPGQGITLTTTGDGETSLVSAKGVNVVSEGGVTMRVSGPLGRVNIQSSGAGGTVNLGAENEIVMTAPLTTISSNMIVKGDLTVEGTRLTLNTQTVTVEDNIIVLNSGAERAGMGNTIDSSVLMLNNFTNDVKSHACMDDRVRVNAAYVHQRNQGGRTRANQRQLYENERALKSASRLLMNLNDHLPDISAADADRVKSRYIDIDACLEMKQAVDVWLDTERKDVNTLSVRSPMGSGKSTMLDALLERVGADKTVLVVTYRQSLALEHKRKLARKGFVSYLDADVTPQDLRQRDKTPRFICQIESLHKLAKHTCMRYLTSGFDIVVLDEVESLLRHFMSPTVVNPLAEIQGLADTLNATTTGVVTMDATWGRGDKAALDTFDDPKDAARLCLLHTSKTADAVKAMLIDVDALWSSKRIVVYTPTISAGVDFSTEHFDRMYLYLCPGSAAPMGALQMTGRVRHLVDTDVRTLVAKNMRVAREATRQHLTHVDLYQWLRWMEGFSTCLEVKHVPAIDGGEDHTLQELSGGALAPLFATVAPPTLKMTVESYFLAEIHNASFDYVSCFADLAEPAGHRVDLGTIYAAVSAARVHAPDEGDVEATSAFLLRVLKAQEQLDALTGAVPLLAGTVAAPGTVTDILSDDVPTATRRKAVMDAIEQRVMANDASEGDKFILYLNRYCSAWGVDRVDEEFLMENKPGAVGSPKARLMSLLLCPILRPVRGADVHMTEHSGISSIVKKGAGTDRP